MRDGWPEKPGLISLMGSQKIRAQKWKQNKTKTKTKITQKTQFSQTRGVHYNHLFYNMGLEKDELLTSFLSGKMSDRECKQVLLFLEKNPAQLVLMLGGAPDAS